MKQHIVLVMELCEYDLDHLVKVSPFREDDITLFLFQLGERVKYCLLQALGVKQSVPMGCNSV